MGGGVMGMNTNRGVGDGKYLNLSELLANADNAIKENDLLFSSDTGFSYQATVDVNSNVIANTSPILYAQERSIPRYEPSNGWDFEVVFNDGVELRSGYGNRNTHGNKAIDFSRASGTGSINKSGVIDTLAVDEPSITSDGLETYEEVTNELLWSEDFSNAAWVNAGAVIEPNTVETKDPYGGNSAIAISDSSIGGDHVRQSVGVLAGKEYRYQIMVKTGGTAHVTLRCTKGGGGSGDGLADYNFATDSFSSISGEVANLTSLVINDGWVVIGFTLADSLSLTTQITVKLQSLNDSGKFYVATPLLAQIEGSIPYIKTEAIPATRSPDLCSLLMMGNMPAAGKSFSIEYEGAIPTQSANCTAFRAGSDLALYRNISNEIVFQTTSNEITATVDEKQHTITVVYDVISVSSVTKSIYVDEVLLSSQAGLSNDINYSLLVNMFIGSDGSGGAFLNSSTKALRIAHKALTPEQIAARGGYNE